MPIQLEAPVTFEFSFRQFDEDGGDLGPLNLDNPEYIPRKIRLRKPDNVVIEILNADIIVTSAVNGLADWVAEPGQLDVPGTWQAQAWAGDWPSGLIVFVVSGPNL